MSKISKKTGNNKIFIFLIIFIIFIFILYFVFGSCNKCKKKTTTPIINEWSSTQIQDLKNNISDFYNGNKELLFTNKVYTTLDDDKLNCIVNPIVNKYSPQSFNLDNIDISSENTIEEILFICKSISYCFEDNWGNDENSDIKLVNGILSNKNFKDVKCAIKEISKIYTRSEINILKFLTLAGRKSTDPQALQNYYTFIDSVINKCGTVVG